MNIIFIEPSFPYNQREFVRALHAAGANVIGIGERPVQHLSNEIKGWLSDYVQVESVVHEPSLLSAVKEAAGIPGTTVQTAYLCRDKPAMKETLRQAGIPCAQSTRAVDAQDAREFARTVGYPLIVKPPAGAGASGTYRIDNDADLERVIEESGLANGEAMAIEEFIEGHEGYLDTLTLLEHNR